MPFLKIYARPLECALCGTPTTIRMNDEAICTVCLENAVIKFKEETHLTIQELNTPEVEEVTMPRCMSLIDALQKFKAGKCLAIQELDAPEVEEETIGSISLADALQILGDTYGWNRLVRHEKGGDMLTIEEAYEQWGLTTSDEPNFVIHRCTCTSASVRGIYKIINGNLSPIPLVKETGLENSSKPSTKVK